MRARFGVLISGNGSTLQALIDGSSEIDICVVIASKISAYGIMRARRAGIPVEVIPEALKGASNKLEAEKWIIETLARYRIQKIFMAGFMKIVSGEFINRFQGNIFNIHPSLLPKYKGLHSFEEALKAGDDVLGASLHHVVSDVDSGEMLLQRSFEVPQHRDRDLSELLCHINEQRVIRESMRKMIYGKIN